MTSITLPSVSSAKACSPACALPIYAPHSLPFASDAVKKNGVLVSLPLLPSERPDPDTDGRLERLGYIHAAHNRYEYRRGAVPANRTRKSSSKNTIFIDNEDYLIFRKR